MLVELVRRTRSIRRFHEDRRVSRDTLRQLVDLTRFTASGANLQPLKYVLAATEDETRAIFPHLAWAGYLEMWCGPEPGERPAAYIIILGDRRIREKVGCDHGIAAQTIMLGASEVGLGGCMLGSIGRDALCRALAIPEHFEILLVLALGFPAEEVVLEPVSSQHGIRYWRDAQGRHHVPKRELDDIIVELPPVAANPQGVSE